MSILKSSGGTPTERLLADLCERSFLKLWSYPNPVKDDGKELCDLLAVFDNHVFIFFDRESRILDNLDADPLVNWARWKRKVIDAQIATAHGAERYIKAGRRTFLDTALSLSLPICIQPDRLTVHKIIVAHGAAEACARFSDQNVYGSLAICYGLGAPPFQTPFLVDLDRANPVHVFDSHNLPIILSELDTFSDLTRYFEVKLEAIRAFDALTYCGEEDLLAHYWLNYDEGSNRYLIGPKDRSYNWVTIGEGEWKDFTNTSVYRRKKEADQDSYFWDDLIQRTCQNALDGTLRGNADYSKGRSAIHEMAREPRFSRRALTAQIRKAIIEFPEANAPLMRHVCLMPSFYPTTAYVFLQLKVDKARMGDYDLEYRPKRQAMLELACGPAKNRFQEFTKIIGIAIDAPKFTEMNSEDFILVDCADWPDEIREHYDKANAEFRFFDTDQLVRTQRRIAEFPTGPH